MRNKTAFLHDHILTNSFDIFAISETWLNCTATNDTYINALLPAGYSMMHVDRPNEQTGGGIALVHKEHISMRQCHLTVYTQFEYIMCTVCLTNNTIDIVVIYRPPPSRQNNFKTSVFLSECEDFFAQCSVRISELYIVGDINIHLDEKTLHSTQRFLEILNGCGLQQHLHEPTHYSGHTLDVLISRDTSQLIKNIEIRDIGLSTDAGHVLKDHLAVSFKITRSIAHPNTKIVTYRKLRNIDVNTFANDIRASTILNNTTGNLNDLTGRYTSGLCTLLDKHAPLVTRTVISRPDAPWYTDTNRIEKRERRRLERKFLESKDHDDLLSYRKQCGLVAKHIYDAKTTYYSNSIESCKGDQKSLFRLTNKLLVNEQEKRLPECNNDSILANKFGNFFHDKIKTIRSSFHNTDNAEEEINTTPLVFTSFRPVTDNELLQTIISLPEKSCELDPIPTWLLKQCAHELLPIISTLINLSLVSGSFPDDFKTAIIRPILKKANIDINMLSNYRPVSNLQFLSKLLERLVALRLEEFLCENNLHDPLQSAYKTSHSTETAMLKLNNDIMNGFDNGKCIVLASLDLSAAFDTVDHIIFKRRLQDTYGIGGTVLQWFESYLYSRQYNVIIRNSLSDSQELHCGVPQGSVLGARMYTLYTQPLSHIFGNHDVKYHCYADDTQVYLKCDNTVKAIQDAITRLESCVADVCLWMKNNALKLNGDKTEFIIFTREKTTTNYTLNVDNENISSCDSVKILGVTLDTQMNLGKHLSNTCRSSYLQIRKINSIRQYLNVDSVKTLVQATVIVKLDYCNSMFFGLPMKSTHRLQLAQNTAARLITKTSRYHHITPILKDLHWLPISKRCQFKILVLTFKSLHNNVPMYLNAILEWYHPRRHLRSMTTTSLVPSRSRTVTYGRRLFDTAAASVWNNLPEYIKNTHDINVFKSHIKTYLFEKEYQQM